jgi:cyclopropane-fatty-acyl-phospholipid synthase
MTSTAVQSDARSSIYADPAGRFTIIDRAHRRIERYLKTGSYSAALAFIKGELAVEGDIFSAVRFFLTQRRSNIYKWWFGLCVRLTSLAPQRWTAQRNIQFHYDRSNAFYSLFLDSHMQYSEAHFETPEMSLDDAQAEKLDRICRSLQLKPGERLLDIGCGWGGLIVWAAEHYRVVAHGCTLSPQQLQFANTFINSRGLQGRVSVDLCHYLDLNGTYDKIASVGMFEHVGRDLPAYFGKVHSILVDRGIFLNRGIVRPEGVSDDRETLFLQRNVFPGSQLVHLADVVREGELAGFDVLGMEELRMHYARTCRAWVERLRANENACQQLVGATTYRTWLLYLAVSSVNFEAALTGAAQVTFLKRSEFLSAHRE